MYVLVVCILFAVVYIAYKMSSLLKGETAIAAFLETELKEIRAAQRIPPASLAYGWFDDGWPIAKTDEEERAPLENPPHSLAPDDYTTHMFIAEYKSMPNPHQRKEFLRQLSKHGVWMRPELLDVIYADENAYVRAWAAGHLYTDFKDYSDHQNPREIGNYELVLLRDPEPVVRAALWSNPHCNRLPWSLIWIAEDWKEQLQSMSQTERLGLMRNPELSTRYVVALLETPSKDLNISRREHVEVLLAAAVNPELVGGSRKFGRQSWVGGGEGNPPFKEYGRMWELSLDGWIDQPAVPYLFIKYIQTTPEVKLAAYNRLLEKREGSDYKWIRKEVIRSCDPFVDKKVLKLAWDDPEESYSNIAQERVGRFTDFVGVK